jgi:hypothetical protein
MKSIAARYDGGPAFRIRLACAFVRVLTRDKNSSADANFSWAIQN